MSSRLTSIGVEDAYGLQGYGLGAGLAVGRFTASLEAVLGGSNRADPDLYRSLGLALQYRMLRIP